MRVEELIGYEYEVFGLKPPKKAAPPQEQQAPDQKRPRPFGPISREDCRDTMLAALRLAADKLPGERLATSRWVESRCAECRRCELAPRHMVMPPPQLSDPA